MPRLVARISDQLVVNRELDLMFICCWLVYGLWGLAAAVAGIPTITDVQGGLYNVLWSSAIALTSFSAATAAIMIFYKTRIKQVVKKKIELGCLYLLVGLVSVYPAFLLLTVASGDKGRAAAFILSLLYVVIPVFRMRHLKRRIKYYESLTATGI